MERQVLAQRRAKAWSDGDRFVEYLRDHLAQGKAGMSELLSFLWKATSRAKPKTGWPPSLSDPSDQRATRLYVTWELLKSFESRLAGDGLSVDQNPDGFVYVAACNQLHRLCKREPAREAGEDPDDVNAPGPKRRLPTTPVSPFRGGPDGGVQIDDPSSGRWSQMFVEEDGHEGEFRWLSALAAGMEQKDLDPLLPRHKEGLGHLPPVDRGGSYDLLTDAQLLALIPSAGLQMADLFGPDAQAEQPEGSAATHRSAALYRVQLILLALLVACERDERGVEHLRDLEVYARSSGGIRRMFLVYGGAPYKPPSRVSAVGAEIRTHRELMRASLADVLRVVGRGEIIERLDPYLCARPSLRATAEKGRERLARLGLMPSR